jgi:DNA-directed RNA polymerase specialized sigma24 family protein
VADPAAFEALYRRHVDTLLGMLAHRTGDPDAAAELCAETFAAALLGAPGEEPEDAWLLRLAGDELSAFDRRGRPRRRARRRLGIGRVPLDGGDRERIRALAESDGARDAVRVRVIE